MDAVLEVGKKAAPAVVPEQEAEIPVDDQMEIEEEEVETKRGYWANGARLQKEKEVQEVLKNLSDERKLEVLLRCARCFMPLIFVFIGVALSVRSMLGSMDPLSRDPVCFVEMFI